jgi:hypothetical protein
MSLLTSILEILYSTSQTGEHQAIAPLAIMGIAAGAQAVYGMTQKAKAGKIKPNDIAEKAAIAARKKNQERLIKRAENREAINTELPGTSRAEENLGASTAFAVENYKEMGNQSGYQDFLNQALQTEQKTLSDLATKNAIYKDELTKDVDSAIAGMDNVYALEQDKGRDMYQAQIAEKAALSGAGDQNIMGGLNTFASGMMMQGGGNSSKAGEGGNYKQYKGRGGSMSRGDWRKTR